MMSGSQRKPLLILLGTLLVAAGIGLNIMLPKLLGNGTAATGSASAPAIVTVPVVVTTTQVVQGTKLDPAVNIALTQILPQNLPADAAQTLTAATGQYATITLPPNTPVTSDMLVPTSTAANQVTFKPIDIPAGSVLFPVDYDASSMAYFLAGDHVDILAADKNNQSTFAINDLLVARIGNPSEQGATGVPTTIELVVTRAQAVQIGNLISGFNGEHIVRWILRSQLDK